MIQTGERRFYGCFMFRKGVIPSGGVKLMKPIVILGIFVADTAYRADRQPKMGETILGTSFVLGPGGKGSNQSVAAAMAAAAAGRISSPDLGAMPLPTSPGRPGPRPASCPR